MAPRQEDRGVEPEGDEIILSGDEAVLERHRRVLDATNRPAAEEDDLGGGGDD